MARKTWDEKQGKYVDWYSGSGSSLNPNGSNKSSSTSFVDPSILHDAQVNWLSQSQIDAKWGTGASNAVNNYDSTYWTNSWDGSSTYAYNDATWYYESITWSSGSSWSRSTKSSSLGTTNTTKTTTNKPYVNQWPWNYTYNPVSWYYEKVTNKGDNQTTFAGEDENHYWILNDKNKTNPETTYSWEWTNQNANLLNNQNAPTTNVDLTGGANNTNMNNWGSFTAAVNNKLQTAFWLQDLNALKQKYPEQYSSLIQSLDSVAGVWNSLDPSQRQLLEWQLQAIIGTAVGAWSDTSKLNVLNESFMDKFVNWERVAEDMRNIVKLQTEWLSTAQIAKQMWMSEDQVQQAILASNGLDNRLWEYYQLKSKEADKITEPYDTQLERLEEEKKIALDRANRNIEWLKEDFDKNMARQKQVNEINAHNADMLSGQYWFWFSKRGIEWLDYVQQQAQNIIDDMVTNYDRNNQEMADWVADILRNWEWNNEDLLKASEDALNNAKNVYTSNMLAIQQQYGTVWMQAQQQMANNVQNFITTAENIYDNALKRQQDNLTNLITNFSNLNALSYSNLTLRNAQIQQFQQESMNLNRNQLQGLAQQLGMDSASYQDLVNYQMQAVANQLNGYLPWAWVQLQGQIQNLLNSWYTPNQAIQSIMNSQEFKDLQTAAAWQWENWSMSGGIMYNKSTGQYIDLNGDEYGTVWDNLYNKRTGEIINANGQATWGNNYVMSESVNGQTYWVSQKTYNGLVNFYNKFADANWNIKKGAKWWQCWSFVNDYLQSLGLGRVFTDPIDKKKAVINTPDWYKGQVWDVIVMDSPNPKTKQYGHVAIIIWVNQDWTYQTLESNKKWEWEVFTRSALDPNKTKVYGYYHPDGVGSNTSWGGLSEYDIDTATMRIGRMAYWANISNTESERVKRVLENWDKMWKSQTEILYDVLWMNIKNNQSVADPLIDVMVQNSDEKWLSAYNVQWFANFINNWKFAEAVNLVEQWVAKVRGDNQIANMESGTIYAQKKGEDLIKQIQNNTNRLGIVAWNVSKWTKKFAKDTELQKLSSGLTSFVSEWRKEMAWSNVTESELRMLDELMPALKDNPYNAITKIQEFQDYWLNKLNARRSTLYLPNLDTNTLLNRKDRYKLYTWVGTWRWLKGTVPLQWRGRS